MSDEAVTCPCGEPVLHWVLTDKDQWHRPFPPKEGKLGGEIAIEVEHADDVRHWIHDHRFYDQRVI